jgi:hypothetical protein
MIALPHAPALAAIVNQQGVIDVPKLRKVANTKAKGTHNEHRSMAIFEAAGYETMRSAASLSTWDFLAWDSHEIVYCQVKTRDWPGSVEMEQIQLAVIPPNGRKVLHRWRDGQRMPDVKEIG